MALEERSQKKRATLAPRLRSLPPALSAGTGRSYARPLGLAFPHPWYVEPLTGELERSPTFGASLEHPEPLPRPLATQRLY